MKRILPFALLLHLLPASAQRVLYEGPGVAVPDDFGCVHHNAILVNYSGVTYGPDPGFDAHVGAFRLYGAGGINWSETETSRGVFDWENWDRLAAILRRAGIRSWIYTLYNPPPFYTNRGHDYGGWKMQLPNDPGAVGRWLSALSSRYPEISVVEVANEVASKTVGADNSFWTGTPAELMQLSNQVLDWRKASAWKGKIWSPSIPDFEGNRQAMLDWLKAYPRAWEFDQLSVHNYFQTADNWPQPTGPGNAWNAYLGYRDGVRALGLKQPINDGEHGFGSVPTPATVYNYAVKAALEGLQQVCYFGWGVYNSPPSDSHLGEPFRNPEMKAAFEKITADLAGKRITKVVDPGAGAMWQVTTTGVPSGNGGAPAPIGGNAQGNDGGNGTGLHALRFPTTDLSGPGVEGNAGPINFTWPDEDFSARFEGYIQPAVAGDHSLRICADDGVRLWLDGKPVLDQWRRQSLTCYEAGTLSLVQGEFVPLRLEYNNLRWGAGKGTATLRLDWKYPGTTWHPVGVGRLYPTDAPPQQGEKLADLSAEVAWLRQRLAEQETRLKALEANAILGGQTREYTERWICASRTNTLAECTQSGTITVR